MKFKKGDKVRCNDLHFERKKRVYTFDNKDNVMEIVEIDDDDFILCGVNGERWYYYVDELELVKEYQEELMIPISLVYQALESEPTNRELKSLLKGYTQGLNKRKEEE